MSAEIIVKVIIYFVAFKALTIGNDFSIFNWIKFGRKYINWYKTRETWSEYQETEELKGRENGS